ncbi:type IV secretory system conjugative DNA transfer family protein, partial [Croceivirga sp. JEA036]|uniref:type IV secretory system conjugative DNA transfer family protein n=1 Tax=Croceivirga sp. JEA036 TaxID=2721162 RepID=UPI00143C03E5
MKNDRIQFVITLLAAATLAMSLYFRVAFDSGITQWIQEPPLLKTIVTYLISKGMGEKNLKLVIIVAPVLAAYLYRFYSDRKINVKKTLAFTIIGLLIILYPFKNLVHLPVLVGMPLIIVGFLLYIRSLMRLSIWFFSKRLEQDQFNQKNQSFPQTTRKYEGKYNFALEYDFYLNGKKRTGQLNFVNIFRSVFVWGIMGSGKTFSFISPIIYELIQKDFSMMVYDLKFPSLSSKVYGYYQTAAPKELDFYQICTTDMRYSHRCNPIAPRYIPSITEIEKICDNVMTNLKRPDESESAFFKGTAMGLFVGLVALSKEMEEKHGLEVCSLPHVSILASVKAKYLLPLLLAKKDIIMKVSSLRDAFEGGAAMEQLVGITASLQEKLSRLYQLDAFYIFSGSGDFSLDLNQPDQKKVVTVGCDKDKAEVMAPYLSMIVETVGKEANKPNKAPFAAILDELSSFYYGGLVDYLESGRENLCALVAGIQGMEQL